MKSPCCDVEMVQIHNGDLDKCPACDHWWLVVTYSDGATKILEVI